MLSPAAVVTHAQMPTVVASPDPDRHDLDRAEAAGAASGLPASFRSGRPIHHLPLTVMQVGETRWANGQRFQAEAGEAAGIELVLAGSLALTQDGRECVVAAGEVAILKPRVAYQSCASGGPVHKLTVGFSGGAAEQIIADLPDRVVLTDQRVVRACFDDLFALYRDLPPDFHLRASVVAYRLLVQISVAHQGAGQVNPMNPMVSAALRILETSGARDLDVRQVARTVGTSVSHLHRLFKEALGTSPLRYAREHLIAQAKDALGTTTLPCQEIARRLGYDDPLYFSAVFKRITGVSPREFRKRHR